MNYPMPLRLLTFTALSLTAAAQQVTSTPSKPRPSPVELSFTYTTLRTNASVGQCGCFWNQGAAVEAAFPLRLPGPQLLSAVIESSGSHASAVPGSAAGLDLISSMGGVRVRPALYGRFQPFAQVLFGGVHAFNSYFPHTQAATTSATSFAMAAGGGLDLPLSRRLAVRAIQADYQYMQLPNNSTNEQHNIRLSAGFLYHFGPDTRSGR